jgi:hypothetical protein
MKKIFNSLFQFAIGQYIMHVAQDSDEYALQVGATATPLDPTQAHGRIRVGHFKFSALTSAADDTLNLLKMPAGKVRVLAVHVKTSAFGAGTVLDVGYGAYTDRSSRDAVVAAPAALASDLSLAAAADLHAYPDVVIDSTGGWTLTGLLQVGAGTAETLSGYVEYVID